MNKIIECSFRSDGPGKKLSNLYPHQFDLDGFRCASMEGFLQSLKCNTVGGSASLRAMSGVEAWKEGQAFTKRWQETQTLYWQGKPYNRQSAGYQNLIKRAYDALAWNQQFANTLMLTGDNELAHSIGNNDSTLTVLTQAEFLFNLYRTRSILLSINT